MNILKKGKVLCIYPEVRFSFAGINERLDKQYEVTLHSDSVYCSLILNKRLYTCSKDCSIVVGDCQDSIRNRCGLASLRSPRFHHY